MKQISKIDLSKDLKPAIDLFKKEVTQKLACADIQVNLLNNYLASDFFNDKFKKEFEVPAVGEPILLDLNYPDGAIVSFKIESQAGDDLEKLNQTQFNIKYTMMGSDKEEKSFKLYAETNIEPE